MSKKSMGTKWKKRLGRWMAIAMTMTLLAGQCGVPVLAEENTESGQGSSVSDNDIGDSIENDIPQCVCMVKCSEESVNGECVVCLADYMQCSAEIVEGSTNEESPDLEEELPDTEDVILEETEENATHVQSEEEQAAFPKASSYIEYDGLMYWVTGDNQCMLWYPNSISGHVEVPATVQDEDNNSYTVTEIKDAAFWNNKDLTSISIPGSVQSIGERAFRGCTNLVSVSILNGLESIGESAFEECTSLTSILIPGSVKSIGKRAFWECGGLTSVEMQDGDAGKSIGEEAFAECSSLANAKIPDSVTNIEKSAFAGCGLTEFRVPSGVKSISSMAFVGCSKLENITIPDSVSSIGQLAFSECRSLRHITIPNSVTYIGMSAFDRCSSLTELTIPASVKSIGVEAFGNCSSLTSVTVMPGSTLNISGFSFQDCSSLTSVTIPDSISAIAQDDPFLRCTSLSALRIMISGSNAVRVNSKSVFGNCPEDRYISFLTADGTAELTGTAYEAARDVYKSDSRDGSATDNKWYGWSFSSQTGTDTTYKVTINVRKDNAEWQNHGKTFALLANGGSEFLYDLEHVPDGTYRIYDVTGVRRDSLWSKAADTGVSVRVNGADTEVDVTVDGKDEEATVDYYTVTFYDEDEDHPYGADTDQRPQVVLKGKAAVRPNDPGKANHVFTGWVTAKDSSTPFDFTNTRIGAETGIYASWRIADAATDIIIEASASDGGSISPAGSISVAKGTDKSFTITPNEGYHIKSVTADGQEVTAEGEGASRTYTFRNVIENHTIHATFERNSGGDNPGGDDGDNKPGGTTGNSGGGTSGGDSTPDGGSNPSGDVGGDIVSTDTTVIMANAENNTAAVTTENSAGSSTAATNTNNPAASNTPQGKEPKTGDATHVEMYATVAMIAGLAYILLYFMDAERGMTEREKEVFVEAFIRWAKRGSGIRKYFALAAIFCLLVYYHGIGKRVRVDWKEAYIK